jgi:tetratricopeptide (TPR) repeat protein
VLVFLGDRQRAHQILNEALSTARAIEWDWGEAQVQRHLGLLALSEGDLDRAEASLSESVAINRRVGASNGLQGGLLELGTVLLVRGEYTRAMASLRESLVLCQEHGEPLGIVQAVEGVAAVGVAASSGASTMPGERAGRLLGAAAAQRAVRGAPVRPAMRPIVEQAETAARAQLGDAAYERVLAEGGALSLDQAAALALELTQEMQEVSSEPDPHQDVS